MSSPPASVPNSRSSLDSYAAPPNPYQPSSAAGVQRTSSPSSFSVRSIHSVQSVRDPYSPPEPTARYRSASNGSAFSLSTSQNDPYAPGAHSRQQSTESYTFEAGVPKPMYGNDVPSGLPNGVPQVQTLTAPHRTPYAPSPSLLGTNDPLGRTAVRIPVITFGFGGKLVTCFHGSDMQTGFEVAMSSRASTSVHIRSLHSVIPQSALEVSTASYPGPLFSDPGTPAATLVRTGAAAQLKAKKAKVVKYLEERSEEISQGLGYLHQGSVDLHRALAKRILINLLKVMVENDGRLSGTPQIDTAVRAALLPNTESSPDASTATLVTPAAGTFELASSSYGSLGQLSHDMKGTKLADHPLWSSQLDKIESFLVRGDRRGAFHYAADEKLWAHAFLIASSIDKEAWKEAVTEFVRSELRSAGTGTGLPTGLGGKSVNTDSREPLRVAYSLFAGQGGACVQELHPTKPLGASNHSLPVAPPTLTTVTPISAAFQQVVQPVTLPQDTLAKWPTTAAMIISGSLPTDCSAALTALGDHLALNNWIEAAHACYLLSPQTSPVGGVGTPGARVVLYGVPNPQVAPGVYKDPDAIIFSEIVEFAMSLTPPAKGQDAFNGLPHLQPYRLLRALQLAELGHMDLANRYCEAISHSTPRSSPYLNAVFLDELKGLSDRLVAAPLLDKSGSWMGSKMARPSLDKIGNWLEGRFTSFIAGEGDSPHPVESQEKVSALSGPFAHYSTISSATNSTMPSPQMSSTNLAESYPVAPPFRTGSAMALRTSTTSPAQIARASSAVDYLRRKPSPVPRGSSAGGSAYGLASKSQVPYGYPNGFNSSPTEEMTTPTAQDDASGSGPRVASWWGSAESQSATPTATSFPHPDGSLDQSSEGFISLMDDAALAGPHTTSQFAAASRMNSLARDDIDEDDDLGLGNSGNRSKKAADTPAEDQKKAAPPPSKSEPVKEADKSAPAGGWLSRLWKRNEGGPVKANLGDENTFYYDAETKRWVNKNVSALHPAKASPPPPPQRSQTASPGMSAARAPPISPAGPPPARPASAIDLTEGPPKKPPMRVRSNLVPLEATSAPNTPASATLPRTPNTMMDGPPGMDAPPTPGQRRAPIKRNARSRYVDVFQEPGS
ncbi:hypothetical protein BDW22DRAFT_1332329 [Trametopsis cervina]|nr:hypothetical protein BDW22DRAFT_1332329 [Trametopsis cervina]